MDYISSLLGRIRTLMGDACSIESDHYRHIIDAQREYNEFALRVKRRQEDRKWIVDRHTKEAELDIARFRRERILRRDRMIRESVHSLDTDIAEYSRMMDDLSVDIQLPREYYEKRAEAINLAETAFSSTCYPEGVICAIRTGQHMSVQIPRAANVHPFIITGYHDVRVPQVNGRLVWDEADQRDCVIADIRPKWPCHEQIYRYVRRLPADETTKFDIVERLTDDSGNGMVILHDVFEMIVWAAVPADAPSGHVLNLMDASIFEESQYLSNLEIEEAVKIVRTIH